MVHINNSENLQAIVKSLQSDGVVLLPSDTVLGLFAQLSEKTKKKLDAIKQQYLDYYMILLSLICLMVNME